MVSADAVMDSLHDLVSDQLKVVSYKWASRHFGLPADDAKRLLKDFAHANSGKVKVVYLLSGWTKEAAPRHVVSLVRDVAVETARSLLGAVSSQHVYSLQPCIPKDPSELHSSDLIQAQELFAQAPLMEDNCLRDNRYSAVKCSLVKRMASCKPSVIPQPKSALPTPKVPGVTTKAIEPKAPNVTVKQAIELAKAPRAGTTEAKEVEAGNALDQKKSGIPLGGSAASSKSRMASMFAKAPPKIAKPQAVVGDAEAALRVADAERQAGSDDSEDDNDQMPVVTRSSRSAGSSLASRRRGCAVLEESDEENENNDDNSNNNTANKGNPDHQDNKVTNSAPESVPQFNGANNGEVTREAQAKPKGKAVKKRNQAQDDQEAPPLAKRKKGAGQPVSDDSMEEDDTNETPVASASHPTEDAKTVAQTSNPASGGLSNSKTPRRRVVRTTMDKKGIESTEVVYIDEDGKEFTTATGGSSKTFSPGVEGHNVPEKPSITLVENVPESSNAVQSKKATPATLPKVKPAGKKAPAKDQKGIMSFFGKPK